MSYLVTAFAAAGTSLASRWLWSTFLSAVRALARLVKHRHAVLFSIRVLAAGGEIEWRVRRPGLDVRILNRPSRPSGSPTT
ncbi:hypothetical protein [Amycolatopsis sp. cmx-4-83]|uniref:hypothetical protein n=1 Tax=Amycolatopsis sp. cmx-4-83 TaxID=2790940 RepID=UPI00397BBE10